jgi:hypothetical protein
MEGGRLLSSPRIDGPKCITRLLVLAAILLTVVLGRAGDSWASEPSAPPTTSITGSGSGSHIGILGVWKPGSKPAPRSIGSSGPRTVYTDCGPRVTEGGGLPGNGACSLVRQVCALGPGQAGDGAAFTTQVAVTGSQVATNCRVDTRPRPAAPVVTARTVRAQVIRLVPRPLIGTAPVGGSTLVQIETVLWVDTAPVRDLGTVALLGHRVAIRASVQAVAWSFGDARTDTTSGPGKAYSAADPCRTAQCPAYFGHTYTQTGRVTVRAQITWSGSFRVDGGAWRAIPGPVVSAAQDHRLTVKQARGVLVPNH